MPYSAIHVRALVEAVRRTGVELSEGLSSLGITADLADNPSGVDAGYFEQLLELCLRQANDPALGLHMGEQASLVSLGLSEVPSTSRATSLRVVLETFLARYTVSIDEQAPVLSVDGGRAQLSFPSGGGSLE